MFARWLQPLQLLSCWCFAAVQADASGFLHDAGVLAIPAFVQNGTSQSSQDIEKAIDKIKKELSEVKVEKHHAAQDFAAKRQRQKELEDQLAALAAQEAAEKAAQEKAARAKAAAEKAAAEKAAAEKAAAEKEAAKKAAAARKQAEQRAEASKLAADKAERARIEAERLTAEAQAAAQKAKHEQAEAEKVAQRAAAARVAAERAEQKSAAASAKSEALKSAADNHHAESGKAAQDSKVGAARPSEPDRRAAAKSSNSPTYIPSAQDVASTVTSAPSHPASSPASQGSTCHGCSETLSLAYQRCAAEHGNPCSRLANGQIKDGLCCSRKEAHNTCLKCAYNGCPPNGSCAPINKKYYSERSK